jgi:hypothetical protein
MTLNRRNNGIIKINKFCSFLLLLSLISPNFFYFNIPTVLADETGQDSATTPVSISAENPPPEEITEPPLPENISTETPIIPTIVTEISTSSPIISDENLATSTPQDFSTTANEEKVSTASTTPEIISIDQQNIVASTTEISTKTAELILPENLSSSIIIRYKNRANEIPLEMSVTNSNVSSSLSAEGQNFFYRETFTNTDLKYEVTENGIKESIILNAPNHPEKFIYHLNLNQFDFVQTSPNIITLYKKGEKNNPLSKLYTLSAPKMIDGSGKENTNITFSIDGDTLTLIPDANWLSTATYPVVIDPTIEITVLNVHSHPVQGEYWKVDFTTTGSADLTITPADQATVNDMQFFSLFCGSEDRTAGVQILSGDVIYYPNWSCDDVATISHLDLKTGDHHLIFQFNNATEEVISEAFNTALVWTGLAGDGKYSTAGNWSTAKVPSAADTVSFDNTCTNCNMTIDVSTTTLSFTMAAGYTGTITQGTDTILTVTNGFSIASGTFVGSASTTSNSLIINGAFTGSFAQTGGIFTAPAGNMSVIYNFSLSAGTFNNNGGTVTFTDVGGGVSTVIACSGSPFKKVIINKSTYGTLTIGSGCTVPLGANPTTTINRTFINNGTITIDSGTWTLNGGDAWQVDLINNGTVTHNGTGWVSGGGYVSNSPSSVLTYNGTTASFVRDLDIATGTFPSGLTVTLNDTGGGVPSALTCSGSPFTKVIINKSNSGGLTISSGCTVPLGANPTSAITGVFTNNGTIIIDSGTWTEGGWQANLTNNGTITHNGTGWVSGGGFVNGSSGVVTYGGTTASFVRDLSIATGTFPSGLTVTLNDTGSGVPSVLTCSGSPFTKVIINKSSDGSMTISSGCIVPLGANPTSATGAFTNNGTIIIDSGTWTETGGVWVLNLTNNGTITHNGTGWVSGGGFTSGSSGVLTYVGTTASFISNLNVANGTFPSGLTITFNDTGGGVPSALTCSNSSFANLTISKYNSFSFNSSCNLTNNLTFSTGTVNNPASPYTISVQGNFSQTSAGTFGGSNLTLSFSGSGASTFSKSAGTFSSPIIINKSSATTTLATAFTTGSTLNISSGTFDAGGFASTITGLTTVSGGNYNASSSTQTLNGGLTVSGGAFTGGTGTVDINGNLILSSGTINPSGTMNLSGNLSNTGGTFSASSGTVTLDGTNQTILGNNTFYNLTKNVGSAATLTFASSTTQTILGTLNLQGAASNLLSLRSDSDGTQWKIDPQGTRTIDYLDVKDSNNTNALVINAISTNSVNSNNNTNWIFTSPTYVQTDYQFYQNADLLQPPTLLGGQSTATTIFSTSTPIRLRMNLAIGANDLPLNFQQFNLQVSTATTTGWTSINTTLNSGWWNSSWQNRRKITFNNSASTENLLNFPVLVSLTSSNINYTKTKALGADIRFVDSDGTALNYEIEKWDATGTSNIWVKVPQIDASSATDYIWMYYNNPAATDNATTTGVWDGNYFLVQHLNESSGTATLDSTLNARNGTKLSATEPSATSTGQISGAQNFDGGNDYIVSNNANGTSLSNLSVSMWVKRADINSTKGILQWAADLNSGTPFIFLRDANGVLTWYVNSNYNLAGGSISSNVWTNLSVTWNGSVWTSYVNGNSAGTYNGGGTLQNNATKFWIGNAFNGYWQGNIDEVRISSTTRSSDWILAEYKTEINNFNTYSNEETVGSNAWIFYNNPSVASGTPISATLLSTSNVKGSYMESNPTATNPFVALIGQLIEYDFALDVSNIVQGISYYFRMVKDDGIALDTYTNYPTLVMTQDIAAPTPGSISVNATSAISLTASISGASDGGSGLSINPYVFYNTTNSANSGAIAGASWLSGSLTPNTNYSFYTTVSDAAGNHANTASVSKYTLANIPGSPTLGSATLSTLTLTNNENNNPASNPTTKFAVQIINASPADNTWLNKWVDGSGNPSASEVWLTDAQLDGLIITGLQADTTYQAKSKARNENNVETALSSTGSGATLVDITSPSPNPMTFASVPAPDSSIQISMTASIATDFGTPPVAYLFGHYDCVGGNSGTGGSDSVWQTSASFTDSGLQPNKCYGYKVQARDSVATPNKTASSTQAEIYTLADIPTALTVTVNSATELTASWSANDNPTGTKYYVLNETSSTTSGWITTTSSTFSNLTCSTPYSFTVKARNADNVETATTTAVIGTTSACSNANNNNNNGHGGSGSSSGRGNGEGTSLPPLECTPLFAPEVKFKHTLNLKSRGNDVKVLQQFLNNNGFPVATLGFGSPGQETDYFGTLTESALIKFQTKFADYIDIKGKIGRLDPGTREFVNNLIIDPVGWCSSSPVIPPIILPVELPPVVPLSPIESPIIIPSIIEPLIISPVVPSLPELPPSEETSTSTPTSTSSIIQEIISDGGVILNNILESTFSTFSSVSNGAFSLAQNIFDVTAKFGKVGQQKLASAHVDPKISVGMSTLVVAPSVLILQYSIGNEATIFNNIKSFTDLWFMILGLFQGLLTSIGLRARRRYWGTVYDSRTKQPIDPAIVELVDATSGEVVEQSVTDLLGRFGFLDQRGRYYIKARKTHYIFPSKLITGGTDSIFDNVYRGELIEITKPNDLLVPNIPMDSVAFDWNQQEKQKIIKFHPTLELVIQTVLSTLFWLGFAFIIFNFISDQSVTNGLFTSLYIMLAVLNKFIPSRKLWGRVVSENIDTSGLLLEISPKQIPQVIVARAMTNKEGKFFLKTSKGRYILRIKKIEDSNLNTISESEIYVGESRVVNDVINLR